MLRRYQVYNTNNINLWPEVPCFYHKFRHGIFGRKAIVPKEMWKDIPGYEGYYQVSNRGKVRSVARTIKYSGRWGKTTKTIGGKLKKLVKDKNGYLRTSLYKNGKSIRRGSHQLVAWAFLPNPQKLTCINHKNGIKDDNRVENLEWCTPEYNENHAKENGLKAKGVQNGLSKLTPRDIKDIRERYVKGVNQYNPGTGKSLRDKYKISNTHLIRIVNRVWWKHI